MVNLVVARSAKMICTAEETCDVIILSGFVKSTILLTSRGFFFCSLNLKTQLNTFVASTFTSYPQAIHLDFIPVTSLQYSNDTLHGLLYISMYLTR